MAVVELQSEDHRNLLDIIDKFRLAGITRFIDLPQIVVCGDQSAGKSSVLEAISGIRFPTKDNLCTRFATELVLRRDVKDNIKVSIIPGPDRDEEECERLSMFRYELASEDPDLSHIIEQAKQTMGISNAKVFSSDLLRVELQGPAQPHLTLVDLPGLFRAGNSEQSVEGAPMVRGMVREYMAKPRCIILAVVSAKSDFALQEVTSYSLELDPGGVRTLGLITKPDTLSKGSESEVAYIAMAQNQDVVFRLGWHVLKNRSFETRDVPSSVRDRQEAQFFENGAWASLDPSTVGIKSLRPRLSNILRDQILQNLPGLHADVSAGITDCEVRLSYLGETRTTVRDRRQYLHRVSWKFSTLLKASVDGAYSDQFFGRAHTRHGQQKRLRAVVQNCLDDFAESMRTKGHAQLIVEGDQADVVNDGEVISRTDYISYVSKLMRHSRGTELPGTFNPGIIGELFRDQCRPWRNLVVQTCHTIVQRVRFAMRAILEDVALSDNVDAISSFVNRAIDGLERDVETKADELLRPYLSGHPITYNHYLVSNVQRLQADRRRRVLQETVRSKFDPHYGSLSIDEQDISGLIGAIQEREEVDMGRYASQLAIDYMQAYYKVAMKNCIDDIAIHVIEAHLIRKLSLVFDHKVVEELDDFDLSRLASEKETAASDRAHNLEKLENFRKALRELEGLDKHYSLSNDIRAQGYRSNKGSNENSYVDGLSSHIGSR
ncbi:hypothetical protein M409DRAFT_23857 [Zasmidium cellare ATCC 36951]|uniref:GED domain-containing protein n=1 Tax=Zasmidium cellare ATCC 36951 TaxID=1080233 RepID=A0A6A6CIW9_ZASCE|nr:uncharacterized protein M409DRAFT_23857 [Zasmidium cellare ATCC 36951]KAF2166128.1 hypothetical protein M409DRAFT_23857 [Zasmidium cellare ATCC 36951]